MAQPIPTQLPEPIRGQLGATIMGPRNVPLERENPDLLASPVTDGTIPNLKFSFANARNRLLTGGWSREVTVRELPISTTMAGMNMRLKPGVIRELHWHKEAEWAYMLAGSARISCIDPEGRNFIDDVNEGDLWNFRVGLPHSIQALADGCEFLLVFDDGERYIFNGEVPPPLARDLVRGPAGKAMQMTWRLLGQQPVEVPGGRVRIVDSSTFKAASTIPQRRGSRDRPGRVRQEGDRGRFLRKRGSARRGDGRCLAAAEGKHR